MRKWAALGVLVLSLLVIGLDLTILSVALPTLARALAATTSELQWMVDSYVLVLAAALLPAGMLADRFGRRRALLLGLLLFGLTSGAAALSRSSLELIAARAGMGLAAAAILPQGVSIMPTIFTPDERRRALALGTVAMGLATPLGPLVAGYLLDHFTWGSIFLINLPIVAVTSIAGLWFIPESRAAHPPEVDVAGTALSSVGLTALVYAIIQAPQAGWTAPVIVACLAGALVLLVVFAVWERRARSPLVDLSLFANPRFGCGTAGAAMVSFALFGAAFVVPQYLQFVADNGPLQTGLRFLPLVGAMIVASAASDPLGARFGPKATLTAGLLGIGAGFGLLSFLSPAGDYWFVASGLVLLGLGLGLGLPPSLDVIMGALPEGRLGVGSAAVSAIRQVAGALSVAVLGSILASIYVLRLQPAIGALRPADAQAARDSIAGALDVAGRLGPVPGAALTAAADGAFVSAATVVFLLSGALSLLVAAVVLAVMPAATGHRAAHHTTTDVVNPGTSADSRT